MLPELYLDDIVLMRKPHPCGSYEWKITRLGADIGLECLGCGRRIMLPRRKLARRYKKIVQPLRPPAPNPGGVKDHALFSTTPLSPPAPNPGGGNLPPKLEGRGG